MCSIVEQSFDMQIICIHPIIIELCVSKKKDEQEEKSNVSHLIFLTLRQFSETLGASLKIE